MLEAFRVTLLDSAKKMAAMWHRAEACQRKIDRIAGGTPAAGEPSRVGTVRQCAAAIASILGVGCPVYATLVENLRAAQAAAEELDNLEGNKRHSQMHASRSSLMLQPRSKTLATA